MLGSPQTAIIARNTHAGMVMIKADFRDRANRLAAEPRPAIRVNVHMPTNPQRMVETILIEVEGLGDSEATLRLSIGTHVIAENLTTAQAKQLVCGILDRIDVFEVGRGPRPVEPQSLH